MEIIGVFALGVIGIGGLMIGALLGWVALFRVLEVERRLKALEQRLASAPTTQGSAPTPAAVPVFDLALPADLLPTQAVAEPPAAIVPQPAPTGAATGQTATDNWQSQWMVWLGGLSVALAGIFMVRYSIEQGLLGPVGRMTMGILSGLALHAGAEWLRRRSGAHPAIAALAGGASITLYAALLAGLHLYQLLSFNLTFVLLAVVSLATMVLSLRQGPGLAAIGLLGGYLVPLLVSTGGGNVAAAMIYALVISTSGLLLYRYVRRGWLWAGVVAGVLGWWLLAVIDSKAEDFQGIYLAIAAYLLLAVPRFDWLLAGRGLIDNESGDAKPLPTALPFSLALLTAAWGFSLYLLADAPLATQHWAPLVIVIGLAARNLPALTAISWLTMVFAWLAIGSAQLFFDFDHGWQLQAMADDARRALLIFALHLSAIYIWLETWGLKGRPYSHAKCALLCLAPVAWLALAYLLTGDLSGSWEWSLGALILGLVYVAVSGWRLSRMPEDGAIIWLILASHNAYSLAAAMYFREAGLTLSLAAQLVTLAWLVRRYQLPWLHWLIKGAIAIVVARLSLNPWLVSYPADVHWSLWTYGGSTLCCAIAAWLVGRGHAMRGWLEAAGLHLLVLTLGAEVRYWLYDGAIFTHRYSLTESAINSCLWAAMALTYHYRARFADHLEGLYRTMASILLCLSLATYLLSITTLNPLWSNELVASRPIFNLLLLAYGLPVILLALASLRFAAPLRKIAALASGLGAFLFISLEIRHLWQGQLDLDLGTGNGELYTYSAVWLLIALACLLIGAVRTWASVNRYGFMLLALVIGKIFLVDMSDLEGLLRVASFMGLGLSLLDLAFLRSRLSAKDG